MYGKLVAEFTKRCDNLKHKPVLIIKEHIEFIRAMVVDELAELESAKKIWEQADALADLIYYILDLSSRAGIDLDPIFNIIHEANMKKLEDGFTQDERGKIIKPKDWKHPDKELQFEIIRQMVYGNWSE
jgi:predicted HAD superfamily Cof-like phosphohydrolase